MQSGSLGRRALDSAALHPGYLLFAPASLLRNLSEKVTHSVYSISSQSRACTWETASNAPSPWHSAHCSTASGLLGLVVKMSAWVATGMPNISEKPSWQ